MMLIFLVLLTDHFFKRRVFRITAVHFIHKMYYITAVSNSRMCLLNYSITKVNTMIGNICYAYHNVSTQASNVIQYLQDMGERD